MAGKENSVSLPEKCCFVGCTNVGVPPADFDFFVCGPCLDELERLMIVGYAEEQATRDIN